MRSHNRPALPHPPNRTRRALPAPLPDERLHLTHGPVTGDQARRVLARVQQTADRLRRPIR